MTRIRGSTVLVTGAASGIGRLMAREAARRGAVVVAWDIDRDALDTVVKEIADEGGEAHAYACDVADRSAVLEAADAVRREVGPVDILVNNAGVVSGRPLLDLSEEDVERTFGVNTLAHFWTTQAFLPSMIERGRGHVVTISSAAGLLGTPRLTAYSASKHAAAGFTESLRLELARVAPQVRTTLVCPGYIDTGMFEGARVQSRHLVPTLHETDVARAVVDAVEHNRDRVLSPPIVHLVAPLRILPTRLFDATLKALGIASSMDHFVGRAGIRQSPVDRQGAR